MALRINHSAEHEKFIHTRIITLVGIILVLGLVLVSRLLVLQIGEHERFLTLAQDNRIDFYAVPPVRGLIYDRNGIPLARNFRVYNLEILPDKVADMDALLHQLSQLLEISDQQLAQFRSLLKKRPAFERRTLKANLSEEEVAVLTINQHRYPGVELRAGLQRLYPYGELTAHVIGYVGRISADDLESLDPESYQGMEYIGKSGIEAYYEPLLLGKPGLTQVETNAHGRVIRTLSQVAPDTGKTIHLGLDIGLQEKAMAALQGYEGSVVALEPESGEILAFVSAPGFDPNPFVNGISQRDYAALSEDETRPLFNRAMYGRYAPGSTIKGFISLVGMENGIDHKSSTFCPGWYSLPGHRHRYRCWKKTGHGLMDGHGAIVQSCDVYYYQLARKLGIEKLHHGMSRFGFGQQTGIDLIGEPSGLMPSVEWKTRTRNQPWYPGETLITGIGQGFMLTTSLQLAHATAILANRGRKVTPHFLSGIEHPQSQQREGVRPAIQSHIQLNDDDFYTQVIASMRDVVHGERGTARRIGQDIRYQMAGKTGTAQVKSIAQGEQYDEAKTEKRFKDHSLFVGFAPLDNPKIAIAVVVEHAGSGSRVAAPIARELIDYYLLEQLGMFPGPLAAQNPPDNREPVPDARG